MAPRTFTLFLCSTLALTGAPGRSSLGRAVDVVQARTRSWLHLDRTTVRESAAEPAEVAQQRQHGRQALQDIVDEPTEVVVDTPTPSPTHLPESPGSPEGSEAASPAQGWVAWALWLLLKLTMCGGLLLLLFLQLVERLLAPRFLRRRHIECARLTISVELRKASLNLALHSVRISAPAAASHLQLVNESALGGYLPTSLREMRAAEFVLSFRVWILVWQLIHARAFWTYLLRKRREAGTLDSVLTTEEDPTARGEAGGI